MEDYLAELSGKRNRLRARSILQLDITASKTQIAKAGRKMLAQHSPDHVQDARVKQERTVRVCTIAQ